MLGKIDQYLSYQSCRRQNDANLSHLAVVLSADNHLGLADEEAFTTHDIIYIYIYTSQSRHPGVGGAGAAGFVPSSMRWLLLASGDRRSMPRVVRPPQARIRTVDHVVSADAHTR